MLTRCKTQINHWLTFPLQSSLLAPGELLYFADVCAGPGGFSEYVLWRKKWDAKAFGFTLKGPNDFKLEEFFAASSELFEPFYGKECSVCLACIVVNYYVTVKLATLF